VSRLKVCESEATILEQIAVKFAECTDLLYLRHLRINRGRTDPQMAQMYADKGFQTRNFRRTNRSRNRTLASPVVSTP
jgi:hypothetical protein